MATITGVDKLREQMSSRIQKATKLSKAVGYVGYSAEYANYVHENMEAFHRVGQAKYLTTAINKFLPKMTNMLKEELKDGGDPKAAIQKVLLAIKYESQKLVPVDTGFLRSSAYTKVTGV